MKRALLTVLTVMLCAVILPSAALAEYEIVCPSPNERLIAPGRDFYVFATVPEDSALAEVRLINENGEVVRRVTGTDKPTFTSDIEGLNAFNADKADGFYMPDLIIDPSSPDSLYDGSIKCYIKNGMLFAVVAGGYYRMNGHKIMDENGVPYEQLAEGKYVIEVEAGETRLEAELAMGVTESKVMARFSPSGHLSSVTQTAADGDDRTYLDALPGYWSPSGFAPGQESNPYFAELLDRWQLADAMEYYNGEVQFYIYNLSATCATVAVELAEIQLDNAVDTRIRAYHYDIGEPLLGYADAATDAYLMGRLIPFDADKRLVFTRAEITDAAEENYHIVYTGDPRPIDVDVYDGVTVPAGKALTLFGVARPIQNAQADLSRLTDTAWEIGNRITHIDYGFTCGDDSWEERREVGMRRVLAEGWEAYSLYECANVFVFPKEYAGKTISVSVKGYDAHDAYVEGADATFSVTVE